MRNWLKNLKIKRKANLMIALFLFGILIIGGASGYLIRSTKVVSLMLAAQRNYLVLHHESLEDFIRFQANTDNEEFIDSACIRIKEANEMVRTFARIESLFDDSKKAQKETIETTYTEALQEFNKDGKRFKKSVGRNAKLFLSRYRLIVNLKINKIRRSEKAIWESYLAAKIIHSLYMKCQEVPSTCDSDESLNMFVSSYIDSEAYNDRGETQKTEFDEYIDFCDKLGIKSKWVVDLQAKPTFIGLLEFIENKHEDFQQAMSSLNRLIIQIFRGAVLIFVLLLGLVIALLTKKIWNMIGQPVSQITGSLKAMSIGDLSKDLDYQSEDEFGELAESYRQMKINLLKQIEHAKQVATGNFDISLKPKSEKDALSLALNHMTGSLKVADDKAKHDSWIESSINELSSVIRGDLDLASLGLKTSGFICKQMDALTGALFTRDNEGNMVYAGGFAVLSDLVKGKVFKHGEGLVGQVVETKKFQVIENLPVEYMNIFSGLGETKPRFLLVVPCIYNDTVFGVFEIGSLNNFTSIQLELIEQISEVIAIAISSAISRTELEILLTKQQKLSEELQVQQEELRQTNEELQVQQEELRQANEELEAQTRELEESKENLQEQQEELRVTNEELAERSKAVEASRDSIKEKNAELEEARKLIEQKAKDLEQASRYKSEFMANMSHELRTPLNSILVLSQILGQNKPDNLNEKQIKSVETIHSSGENLLSLINEILDLSKIEAGRMDLHPEFVNFDSLFTDLKETFNPIADDKKLKLEFINAVKDLDAFETDAMRTGQILKNLLSNALKFTDKGLVRFQLKRPDTLPEHLDPKRKYIAFEVSDTGIGIPSDKAEMIFEAFRQADGTTTRKYGGSGLGLAISRNFARLMGGDITLLSQDSQGSNFTLLLPERMHISKVAQKVIESAKKISAETVETVSQLESDQSITENQDIKKTEVIPPPDLEFIHDDRKHINAGDAFLLIIEDDPSFSQVLYDLAHEKNFKCMIAPNGETGLHYADYYGPSAIILDIGLPGIDGWEVLKRLKENPNTRHIPVHFMSGSDKSVEALKKGAIGFLRKPVSAEQVNSAFDNIENLISKPVKKLLVVEDDQIMQDSIKELIIEDNIQIKTAASGIEALALLKEESFDCMILDLGLEDMTGYELLQKIGSKKKASNMPVIIYTGKDLTRDEEAQLRSYSDRIIIKGIKSPERLLAETTLFMHQVESNLPVEKQKMIRRIHPKSDVMKDKSILIVDDDMRNVFALTSLLEDLGLKIIVGKNGKEGIDKLEESKVDLILMDIMMPEMNGYEAMEHIRKKRKHKDLPIIALTAKAMPGDREKCIQAGASDYLTKPIDADKLTSMLRVWLYQ